VNPAAIFDSAIAGLQSAQAGMVATSQNVTGSAVAGYVRRSPNLKIAGLAPSGLEKTGASFAVEGFTRNYSALLQKQLLEQQSQTSYSSTLTSSVAALDTMMVNASASVSGALGSFFNAAGSLANEPNNTAYQHALVGAANQVADRVRGLAIEIDRIRSNANQGLADVLNQANTLAPQLASVNGQIKGAFVPGVSAPSPDLLDERDRIASQLQELIGGTTLINEDGTASYLVQGQHLVDRQFANQFTNSTGTTPLRSDQGPNDIRLKVVTSPGMKPNLVQLGFAESVSDAGTANAKVIPAQNAFKEGQAGAYTHLMQTFVPNLQMSMNLLSLSLVDKVNAIHPIFGFANQADANTPLQDLSLIPVPSGGSYAGLMASGDFSTLVDQANVNSRHFDPKIKQALLQSPVNAALFQANLVPQDLQGVSASVGVNIESLRQAFTEPLTFITSSVATTIATWKNNQKANDAMSQILSDQKNAVSGVNLDEEAANLVKYQQLYNASSKLIQTGRQMFDTLLAMMSGN
jgi:flagellar hook-associated protein 1 FlgK